MIFLENYWQLNLIKQLSIICYITLLADDWYILMLWKTIDKTWSGENVSWQNFWPQA